MIGTQVPVTLTPEQLAAIDRIAADEGKKRGETIRGLVAEALEHHTKDPK